MVSVGVILGDIFFNFGFLYFGAFITKQLFDLRLLDMIIANSLDISTISYSTRARGIIVNYFSFPLKVRNSRVQRYYKFRYFLHPI